MEDREARGELVRVSEKVSALPLPLWPRGRLKRMTGAFGSG
jgi:hypothetical protein